jgi:phosphatidylglycerophosphate synthase
MNIPQIEAHFDFEKSMKNVRSYPFLHKYLPFDRYVVRPPASLIVKALFRTAITPNQLTVTSLFFALLAAVAFSYGRPVYFAVGGGLTLVSTIFDAADGMLARAKDMTSRYGAFLDIFLDRIADFAVLAGASYGYYAYTRNQAFLTLGLVTIGIYFLQLTLYYIEMLYTRAEKSGEGAEAKSLAVCYIFVVSIAGRPDLILVAVFLMSVTSGVIKIIRFLRRGRDPETSPDR